MTPRTRRGEDFTMNDAEAAERAEATTEETGFVEYVGSAPYGTEFEDFRQITRREAKDAWDISIPRDLRWTKAQHGQNRGRMLLPLADVPAEVRDLLLEDKAFKVVEK